MLTHFVCLCVHNLCLSIFWFLTVLKFLRTLLSDFSVVTCIHSTRVNSRSGLSQLAKRAFNLMPCHTVFQSDTTLLHSHWKFECSHCSVSSLALALVSHFNLTTLVGLLPHCVVVLICICIVTDDIENLSMCLFVVFSFVNHLFNSVVHAFIELFLFS